MGTSALLKPGTMLAGKYRIGRLIAEGGMGVVYEAMHLRLQQRVAIKMLLPGVLNPEHAARFEREARAAAKIESANIAKVLDVDTSPEGLPYMVIEFLEGHDLGEELAFQSRLPIGEAVGYILEACIPVGQAHAMGIVHRDLKPSNLFLAQVHGQRMLKLLDFGISMSPSDGAKVTAEGQSLGTPHYMSPEQVRHADGVDQRTDIWSLGIILYELLTGEVPFPGAPSAVIAAIAADPVPPPRVEGKGLPVELERVIMKALEKDPEKRFATVQELARALAPFAPEEELVPISSVQPLPGVVHARTAPTLDGVAPHAPTLDGVAPHAPKPSTPKPSTPKPSTPKPAAVAPSHPVRGRQATQLGVAPPASPPKPADEKPSAHRVLSGPDQAPRVLSGPDQAPRVLSGPDQAPRVLSGPDQAPSPQPAAQQHAVEKVAAHPVTPAARAPKPAATPHHAAPKPPPRPAGMPPRPAGHAPPAGHSPPPAEVAPAAAVLELAVAPVLELAEAELEEDVPAPAEPAGSDDAWQGLRAGLGAPAAAAVEPASGEKPSGEKPSAEKPSAEKPSAEKPSAEKPSAEPPRIEGAGEVAAVAAAAEVPAAGKPGEPSEDLPVDVDLGVEQPRFAEHTGPSLRALQADGVPGLAPRGSRARWLLVVPVAAALVGVGLWARGRWRDTGSAPRASEPSASEPSASEPSASGPGSSAREGELRPLGATTPSGVVESLPVATPHEIVPDTPSATAAQTIAPPPPKAAPRASTRVGVNKPPPREAATVRPPKTPPKTPPKGDPLTL